MIVQIYDNSMSLTTPTGFLIYLQKKKKKHAFKYYLTLLAYRRVDIKMNFTKDNLSTKFDVAYEL